MGEWGGGSGGDAGGESMSTMNCVSFQLTNTSLKEKKFQVEDFQLCRHQSALAPSTNVLWNEHWI